MRKTAIAVIVLIGSLLLSSCTLTPPPRSDVGKDIDQALLTSAYNNHALESKKASSVPAYVSQALTPNLSVHVPGAGKPELRRFNLAVKDMPAQDFFNSLFKDTPQSVMVSPQVSGTITLDLKSVTLPEVLNAVRDTYGYEYQQMPYGYKILPRELETRMFTVNYLNVNRASKSETTISSGQITSKIQGSSGGTQQYQSNTKPSSTVETTSDTNFWKTLNETLKAIVADSKDSKAKVIVNPQSGLVIVRAYPQQLRNVARYLDSIQNIVQREVIIEAKVLEIELSAQYQAGIDWTILGLKQTGYKNFEDGFVKAFTQMFTLTADHDDAFHLAINLLNTQGKVNVLSSPRIATLNNQKAVIKVGTDRFFVTNVESTTATSGVAYTGEISQNIDFTPFFSGIALDVTPQINANGMVTLYIHPIVSQVTQEDKKFTVNDKAQNIPLAVSTIRESDSIVEAKNGQVIIIGGLMEDHTVDHQNSTPGADRLPGLSGLFKSPNRNSSKFELVILLRPIIVGGNTWTKALNAEAKRTREMQQGNFGYVAKLDRVNG